MLNSAPASRSKPKPPPLGKKSRAPAPKRKRGGQPGNTNALQHGYYSALKPHPDASIKDLAPAKIKLTDRQPYDHPDRVVFRLEQILNVNDSVAEILLQKMDSAASLRKMLLLSRVALKVARSSAKVMKEIYLIQKPKKDLLTLAQDAHRLVQWEFIERGIPEKTIFLPLDFEYAPKTATIGLRGNRIILPSSTQLFVPQELINLRTNLDEFGLPVMESPFLTDQQWLLVRESLASLRKDQDFFRKYKRRKPRFSTRLLLEAVLIKLAFNLRWEELPSFVHTYHPDLPSFPLRECQGFYRDLFNSGHLQAIYKILHWHLHVYGEANLTHLVEQDAFQISKKDVSLSPDLFINWRLFTALLLLQRAFHNQRACQREQDAERRRQTAHLREPRLRINTPRAESASQHKRSTARLDDLVASLPPRSKDEFGYESLKGSLAEQKWQAIEKRESIIQSHIRSSFVPQKPILPSGPSPLRKPPRTCVSDDTRHLKPDT